MPHLPATRLCLVRHGETAWNAQRRLQGHADIPLNPRGQTQARAVAAALQNHSFAAIYHSDLQRAAATARIIADGRNIPLIAEPALRERHFGLFQGLTRDESEQRFPGLYAEIRTRNPAADLPGGETLQAFSGRIAKSLTAIARHHAGQSVLIVSHGGCMDIMYRLVTDKPLTEPRDFPLGNATLNWVEWQENRWNLQRWDEKDHLQSLLDEVLT